MILRPGARPARRGATAFVLVTVLLDALGLGLVMPVAPRLVASLLGGDLGEASRYYGLILSLYAVMQLIFAPVLGGLSDRFGRRSVILLALLGSAASYLASAFAPSVGWLFAGRAVAGIMGASFTAANAYVADVTPPEKRAQAFGLVVAALGLGFILGPAVGGVLGDMGLRLPYFVAAGLNFANMLYGLVVLPESLAPEHRAPFSLARSNPFGAVRGLLRSPVLASLSATAICGSTSQSIALSIWALSTQARFGWSLRDVGLSIMTLGLATAVVQGGLVRYAVPRLGERRALAVGLSMSILGLSGFGMATSAREMLAFIPIVAIGGLSTPAVQALASREVGPSEQGELQGALNGLGGLAAIVGPLLATWLFARFAPEAAAVRVPGAPFYAAAALNGVGLLLAPRLFARVERRRWWGARWFSS